MMVARSGLFVAPAAGPVGASPTDARLALTALTGTTAMRASGGAITQSGVNMQITVAAGVWLLPDATNASAMFLSATDPFIVTPAVGPGTGSRIDLICVKQNNVENSDADSRANVILVAGTAGAPGVAPAVPAGAYLYASVAIPALITNAAAATVTVLGVTTFGPLSLTVATFALLNTFAGQTNQRAYCTGDGITYRYSGSAWKAWESDWITFAPTVTNITLGTGGTSVWAYKYVDGDIRIRGGIVLGSAGFAVSGVPAISLPVNRAALIHPFETVLASVVLYDVSASTPYLVTVLAANTSVTSMQIVPNASGPVATAVSSTVPFTWAAGDGISADFTYRTV